LIPLEPQDDATHLFRSLNLQREALYNSGTRLLFLISRELHPRFLQKAHDLNTWIAPAYTFTLPHPDVPDLPPPSRDVSLDLAKQIDYYRDIVQERMEQDEVEWVCDYLLPDLADAYKRAGMYDVARQIYHCLKGYHDQQANDKQRDLFGRRARITQGWRILQQLALGSLSYQDSTILHELFGQQIFSFEKTAQGAQVTDEDGWTVDFPASLRPLLIAFSTQPVLKPSSPPPPAYFTGREAELEVLAQALTTDDTPQSITALQGMGGIGKTALAAQLAAQLVTAFPGGVFWADLSANDGDPLPVLAAWARLCDQDMSGLRDPQARAQAVRSILTGRLKEQGRLLVVLDDVREGWLDGARVLQSARPPDTPLLLTTRDEEVALALGATVLRVDVLPLEESLKLLAALAGPVVEQEMDAACRLAQRVGYLPLALELVGKLAALRARKPGWRLANLCEEVDARATETLQLKGQRGLAATFSLSYETLGIKEQQLFRTLGAFAPAPFAAKHVAAVLEWDVESTEEKLDALVALSLARWEREEGNSLRYTLHPLLHDYAAALLEEVGEGSSTHAAHAAYYLDYAWAHHQPTAADHAALEAEHQNLMAVLDQLWVRANVRVQKRYSSDIGVPLPVDAFVKIRRSAEEQAAEQYIEMHEYLRNYFRYEGRWLDYRRSAKRAYAAACALRRIDNAAWEACGVAYTYSLEGRYDPGELKMAEDWVTRVEEVITKGKLAEEWRARALRLRGVIAMRRYDYGGSRHHFKSALHLLEKFAPENTDICVEIADLYTLLAILEMRYSRNTDARRSYDVAMAHFDEALVSAEKYEQKYERREKQAFIKMNMTELMIWWDEWDSAAQLLEEVVPLSRESGRMDFLAKCLAWDAFVYQHKSKDESNSDKKIELLDIAIEKAEESLEVLRDIPISEPSLLNLVGAHLLLAGLHRNRQDVGGDAEDSRKSKEYLSKADDLLEKHKLSRSDATGESEPDPDALYEAACYEVMSEAFDAGRVDSAYDLLFAAITPQPGWYKRAETDFRLDPVKRNKREWKEFGVKIKEAVIIGGEL
jgi:hypothetical protein